MSFFDLFVEPLTTLEDYRLAREGRPAYTGNTEKVCLLDDEGFKVCVDVRNFETHELSVKIVGRQIIVEGKHDEREEDDCFATRHFIRRYMLPRECNSDEVYSTLTADGYLTIRSPRIMEANERVIEIRETGDYRFPRQQPNSAIAQNGNSVKENGNN